MEASVLLRPIILIRYGWYTEKELVVRPTVQNSRRVQPTHTSQGVSNFFIIFITLN